MAVALLVAGCGSDAVGPQEAVTTGGLRLSLAVAPSTIYPPGALTATLRIENLSREPVELVSACGAVALLIAFRGGARVDLEGAASGCPDVITTFEIGANEVLTRSYEIRAVRQDGSPIEEGIYVLRTEFKVGGLPNLQVPFKVEFAEIHATP